MHRHIPTVAVLLIVQGALELLLGVFMAAMGPFMILAGSLGKTHGGSKPELEPWVLGGIYLAISLPILIGGALKVVAGIRNLRYRGRVLGLVALGSAVLAVMTCYCMPTAIALAIYGMIVYLDGESARAFALGEDGHSPEEIQASFLKEQAPQETKSREGDSYFR